MLNRRGEITVQMLLLVARVRPIGTEGAPAMLIRCASAKQSLKVIHFAWFEFVDQTWCTGGMETVHILAKCSPYSSSYTASNPAPRVEDKEWKSITFQSPKADDILFDFSTVIRLKAFTGIRKSSYCSAAFPWPELC